MNKRRYRRIVPPLMVILLLLMLPRPVQTQDTDSSQENGIRPTMQAIFQALTTALPLSLTTETFKADAHRQRIHDALQALSSHAIKLTQHGQNTPATFDFLRRSLRRDAQQALTFFEAEKIEQSRFVLHRLTDNCFLCHARLPSSRPFPLGKRFLEGMPINQLNPHERVRLAVAARQFSTALADCEMLFRSTELRATQIDHLSLFEDYMRIAIGVHSDFPRVLNTLETFQRRSDVPQYLAHHLTAWIEALKILRADTSHDNRLPQARTLIQQGQNRNRYLADRQGLVHFTAASSLLHRYVNGGFKSKPELSEAYYLLGVAESYIPRTSWIAGTEFYLETAIRLDPASPFGKKAFAFLEEYLIIGYSGSSGLHLPEDIQHLLNDLRALVHGLPEKR